MKKVFAIMIALTGMQLTLFAQPSRSIFIEVGGPGLASVNFDTRFGENTDGFGGRIGIGAFSLRSVVTPGVTPKNTHSTVVYVPIGVNYIKGNDGRNFFELGAGVTPAFTNAHFRNDDLTTTFGYILVGYRIEPEEGGITFRVFLSPAVGGFGFVPWLGGVSVGYKFGGASH